MGDQDRQSGWRVFWDQGGWWKAVLVAAVYVGAYLLIGRVVTTVFASQIRVEDMFEDGRTLFLAVALPILLGGALALAFVVSLGWQRELFARHPLPGRGWMWIAVALLFIPIVLHVAATDWASYPVPVVLAAVGLGVAVGFTEEILTRGLAVDLLRRAGHGERVVAMVSSLIFASMHLTNLVSGQSAVAVILTVVYTFGFGMFMYLVLRVTRRLIWPMIIHGLTDPTSFLAVGGIDAHGTHAGSGDLIRIAGSFNFIYPVLGVIALLLIRGRVGESYRTTDVNPSRDGVADGRKI